MLSQFVIEYNTFSNKFVFKKYKVSFNRDGKDTVLFTNDIEYANSYSKNIPGINGYQISDLGLVVEYDERLTKLNSLKLDNFTCTTYLEDLNKFILTGMIRSNHEVTELRDLGEAYLDKAKEYYHLEAINLLKKVRQKRQLEGVIYGKYMIDTLPDDINIIKGTYEQIKNGFIEYVDLKVSDTEFLRIDHDKCLDILILLQSHTQACFTAESKLQEYLKTLSLEELQNLTTDELEKDKINIKEKFDGYYENIYTTILGKLEITKNAVKEEYRKQKSNQGAK